MRVTSGDVIVILAIFFLAWGALDQRHRKRFEREAAREAAQFRADYQAGLAARQPLEALIEATREEWGPDADVPVPFLPSETADLDEWEQELAEGSDL